MSSHDYEKGIGGGDRDTKNFYSVTGNTFKYKKEHTINHSSNKRLRKLSSHSVQPYFAQTDKKYPASMPDYREVEAKYDNMVDHQ